MSDGPAPPDDMTSPGFRLVLRSLDRVETGLGALNDKFDSLGDKFVPRTELNGWKEACDSRHHQAAEGGLQHRGVLGIPDQPVAEGGGRRIERAGPRHAEMGPAGAAPVLHEGQGAHVQHLDVHDTSRKRTRVPGASSAGGSRRTFHSVTTVWPMNRHPPGETVG